MSVKLTKRQRSVIELLSTGFSNREAAIKLKMTELEMEEVWAEISRRLQASVPATIDEYALVSMFDRVDRRRLEAELWASEARLNALMDTAPEAVLLIEGRSGRILKVNNRALTLLGYSPKELVNQPMEMLIPPDLRTKHVGLRNGFLSSVRKREMGYHPPIYAVTRSGQQLKLDIALTATAATEDVMVVCNVVLEATIEDLSPIGNGQTVEH
jgi:PAS domain S-box-containing protein